MKRRFAVFTIAALACSFLIPSYAADSMEMKSYSLGDEVAPFTLKDASGNDHDLSVALGEKVVVVYFWSCQCPVSKAYENRLISMFNDYKDKDVTFCVISANQTDSVSMIQDYAKEHELPYPIMKDSDDAVADLFGAQKTPEVFVIGKDKKLYYHGAVDNSQNPDKADQHYVRAAIDALLANQVPLVQQKPAFGCGIKRK
ncbi:MAG: redoxin domain-containing protein [bacterium]|nr:redoxin domain-containing protein [bacterium]